jgi:Malectin domain
MRLTNRAGRRLAVAIGVALLLAATLLAAQATPSARRAVGDFKIFLPQIVQLRAPLRIDSAANASYTDSNGNLWQADSGFIDGQTGNLGNIPIANTNDPQIYRTERFKLTGYALAVANGSYQVRLHFAESFYTAPGQRVFNVTVESTPIANIDVFAEAGATRTALIKTANVTVSDNQLNLGFTAVVGETMIDGIEVIPQ